MASALYPARRVFGLLFARRAGRAFEVSEIPMMMNPTSTAYVLALLCHDVGLRALFVAGFTGDTEAIRNAGSTAYGLAIAIYAAIGDAPRGQA